MSENKPFIIATDSTCDLPQAYIDQHQLPVIPFSYQIGETEYDGDKTPFQSSQEFYAAMRAGSTPTTAQVNMEKCQNFFSTHLAQGTDVLYISFSSALSGSYNVARMAAEECVQAHPEGRAVVIDSLCASLGEGLLVHYALQLQSEGKTLDEIVTWIEENKLHFCHNFTVDDLKYLYRGGRVSKTAAVLGTVLGIKPVLHVDNEGRLVPVAKVRGRKQSLTELVDMMEKRIAGFDNKICFISHGDCIEDAEFVKGLVRKRCGIKEFLVGDIGPIIGAHSGPGTVALFFIGNER